MEKHILPAADTIVAALASDITIGLTCDISESATTGEPIITRRFLDKSDRRFRLQLIEITA